MRHIGLFLLGSLALSACASSSPPPAASSSSVERATNEPNRGPDFSPASSDGLAATPAATRSAEHPTQAVPEVAPADEHARALDPTNANAAAAPTDRSAFPNMGGDDSRVKHDSKALTPMDQGSSASDRAITQQIRKELMKDKSLSFTAKNVKVITIDGKVTLRGAVKTEAERSAVEAAARRAAGDGGHVDSQLELSK